MTPKQQRFVEEYLIDLNATQAAIRAGYSQNGAKQCASRLLTNVDIAAGIAEGQHAAAQRTEYSVDSVMAMLSETYQSARSESQHSTAHATAVSIGKHLGMWPNRLTITDADKEAARAAAEKLGLDEAEVLAEVERELREARA